MEIIEQAGITFMLHYYKSTNMGNQVAISGKKLEDECKGNIVKHWNSPSVGWLKWHRCFRIVARQSTSINIMCRDNTGRPHYSKGKIIGDCPIFY